jgi:hypothetical protein
VASFFFGVRFAWKRIDPKHHVDVL